MIGLLRRNAQTKAHATDTAAMAATTRGAELLRLICQYGWNSEAVAEPYSVMSVDLLYESMIKTHAALPSSRRVLQRASRHRVKDLNLSIKWELVILGTLLGPWGRVG